MEVQRVFVRLDARHLLNMEQVAEVKVTNDAITLVMSNGREVRAAGPARATIEQWLHSWTWGESGPGKVV